MKTVSSLVRGAKTPLAMPIATFPGAALTGYTVRDLACDGEKQALTQMALHRRFKTGVLMSCMDLSVEAEAFGASVTFSDTEVPTVTGRFFGTGAAASDSPVPEIGAGRTGVTIDAVRRLAERGNGAPVLAGMIGPFSLAGRLFGVSEALLATAEDPDAILPLLEKGTEFLARYARAFKSAGARGVIIAEPSAGLLSPRGMAAYSSPYVRRIAASVEEEGFEVILHNCAAKTIHLDAVAASGAHIVHFGAPMDIPAALAKLPREMIVCGNLDPAA
ncbi:MAG TPA: uroporphyrinogen decarboxylase family protein, partial [Bacteroidota bacterium]|nr:uroporphyrinogen decarboxylase family protein [Bacteroidota bacterium]